MAVLFKPSAAQALVEEDDDDEKGEAKTLTSLMLAKTLAVFLVVFAFTFAYSAITVNVFTFAAVQMRAISNQFEIWKSVTFYGVGAFLAIFVWSKGAALLKRHPNQEKYWSAAGLALGFIALLCFPDYASPTASPYALFVVGSLCWSSSAVLFSVNIEIDFSKTVSDFNVPKHSSKLLGFFGQAQNLAFLFGPLAAGFALPVIDAANGGGRPCTDRHGGFNPNTTCCFLPSAFKVDSCELKAVNLFLEVVIVFYFFFALVFGVFVSFRVLHRHGGVESGSEG